MKQLIEQLLNEISILELDEKIKALNELKKELHKISPFKNEPVDCVLWVKNEYVYANDYNPNSVAPPEMKLLHVSISEDGYTQPDRKSTRLNSSHIPLSRMPSSA